jgi:hypothetical protein
MRHGVASDVRPAVGFAAFAVAVLLVTLAGSLTIGARPSDSPAPTRSVTVEAHPAANTSINDDLELNATPPGGTFAPGTLLRIDYRITVQSASPATQVTIYMPALLASFPGTPAPANVFLPPRNLTLGVGATLTAAPGAFTLRNTTSFNGTRPATLNSELVSLMGSEPYGSISLVAQWNWSITTPNGATTTSGWGPLSPPVIQPAQVAVLQSLVPRSLVPPAAVTACLTGPVQGRTFSLHAETPKPFDDFVGNTTRNPVNGPSTFCLSVVIPLNITPQTILMHLWDYEAVTLLLYIVKVKVGNNSSGPPSYGLPGTWTEYANGAIVVGALGVGIATAIVARRDGPEGPGWTPPPGPPT